ncbi:Uncharacterized protein FWK35_00017699 [Aphis craccivora]|uniref:Uncharacterized protein n=1 Tax=Aphis craccivora TaxID=307492 RepID=A0A6G0YIL1_APHCR|nr:Uncharacterized protein FWK35_00017699 [Aphis craccivora]
MCGQQEPEWTREGLLNYTELILGYNKENIREVSRPTLPLLTHIWPLKHKPPFSPKTGNYILG